MLGRISSFIFATVAIGILFTDTSKAVTTTVTPDPVAFPTDLGVGDSSTIQMLINILMDPLEVFQFGDFSASLNPGGAPFSLTGPGVATPLGANPPLFNGGTLFDVHFNPVVEGIFSTVMTVDLEFNYEIFNEIGNGIDNQDDCSSAGGSLTQFGCGEFFHRFQKSIHTIDVSGGTTITSVVPLPAALPLFGTGLALIGFAGWRRKRAET